MQHERKSAAHTPLHYVQRELLYNVRQFALIETARELRDQFGCYNIYLIILCAAWRNFIALQLFCHTAIYKMQPLSSFFLMW